jgi:hypothetical protein
MNEYTHTVHCWNDKSKRKHFNCLDKAVEYANGLSQSGYKVKIFPYKKPRSYLDDMIDRYNKGEIHP